jgi:hypothetical protein
VKNENICVFNAALKIAQECAMGFGDHVEKFSQAFFAGAALAFAHGGFVNAVTQQCLVEAMFHEPLERDHWRCDGAVRGVAFSVKDQVEYVVVIATQESGALQGQEIIDDALGIRSAVDVIAGEDDVGVGVFAGAPRPRAPRRGEACRECRR